LTSVLRAQYATVQNAVAPSVQASFGFALNAISLVGIILPANLWYAPAVPLSPNIVSPGMLAILTWGPIANPFLLGIPPALSPVSPPPLPATVSIRSSGSTISTRLRPISLTQYSVTFVVPRNMPLGGAEIEYKVAGMPTGWTSVNVVPASLELYR